MLTFLSFFSTGLSCIFYGAIITAFIMATLYFILKTLSEGAVKSVPFYLAGVILAVLLLINMSIIVGAFTVKSNTDSLELWLQQKLNGLYGIVDMDSSQAIGDMVNEEFPLLDSFINLYDWSGNRVQDIPQILNEGVNREMNRVILRNFLWSLGFIVAAMLVALYFDKGGGSSLGYSPKRQRVTTPTNYDNF